MVPDGVLRGVYLRPRPLLDPGQSCSSGPLGSFTGSIPNVLRSRAALHLIGLGAAVSQGKDRKRWLALLFFLLLTLKASKRGHLQTQSTKLQVPFTVEDGLNKLVLGLT